VPRGPADGLSLRPAIDSWPYEALREAQNARGAELTRDHPPQLPVIQGHIGGLIGYGGDDAQNAVPVYRHGASALSLATDERLATLLTQSRRRLFPP
jgi:hypothetical protein